VEVYTNDDELPEDIAKDREDRKHVETLPEEHKQLLRDWGIDVDAQIEREREADGAS
jgi:transcriptional regulator of met regulon